ncbi:MAG: hypothetical protein ACXADW_20765 [Candidatus Hodarchaeales archaeon]|jgi:hypothetical protein
MSIIISKDGKKAVRVERSSFKDEDYLQRYIHQNPDSVPLYEIDENIRLLILAREFPTNSGSIDALGVDADGEIYLVETKLYKNSDKRLVVAQVLDYGAALSFNYRDFSEFLQVLESKVNQQFSSNLNQKIADFFGFDGEQVSLLLDNVRSNLETGRFKFVVLMDQIDSRLKDLIVFLNQNSRFDVYGVELDYFKFESYEIIIPKLFGAEVKKDVDIVTPSGTRKRWDEESFFTAVDESLSHEDAEVVKNLYEFSKEKADRINWGTGSQTGSSNPIFNSICPKRSLYSMWTNGTLSLNYAWIGDNEKEIKYRDIYKAQLDKIFNLPEDLSKFPNLDISEWKPKRDDFKKIIEDLIKLDLE